MGIFEDEGRKDTPPRAHAMLEGAAAGIVGAMAMTGIREFAGAMGWVELTPPEDIAKNPARSLMDRIPSERREAVVEAAHWVYGALGGAMFGLLPKPWRRRLWVGPLYGLTTWAVFQAVLAPALGLTHAEARPMAERAVLIADHLVYGLVVSEPLAAVTG